MKSNKQLEKEFNMLDGVKPIGEPDYQTIEEAMYGEEYFVIPSDRVYLYAE